MLYRSRMDPAVVERWRVEGGAGKSRLLAIVIEPRHVVALEEALERP